MLTATNASLVLAEVYALGNATALNATNAMLTATQADLEVANAATKTCTDKSVAPAANTPSSKYEDRTTSFLNKVFGSNAFAAHTSACAKGHFNPLRGSDVNYKVDKNSTTGAFKISTKIANKFTDACYEIKDKADRVSLKSCNGEAACLTAQAELEAFKDSVGKCVDDAASWDFCAA